MKIFISGPMTGLENYNTKEFNDAELLLREAGWTVFNPVNNGVDQSAPRSEHMHADLTMLLQCDIIYSLYHWDQSIGATLEFLTAKNLGMNQILQNKSREVPTPYNYLIEDIYYKIIYQEIHRYRLITLK